MEDRFGDIIGENGKKQGTWLLHIQYTIKAHQVHNEHSFGVFLVRDVQFLVLSTVESAANGNCSRALVTGLRFPWQ